MATLNGVPFKKNMLSSSKYSLKAPYAMSPKKITIHNTDNSATAANEISYMVGNSSVVGFHIGIDEKEAVQGIPFNRNAYHAGDGGNGYGNRNTVGVEMARSYDRNRNTTKLNDPLRAQFNKTFQNTIKVVAQLCVNLGITANSSNIKQHKDWSGKYCPRKVLDDKDWNRLLNGIVAEYNRIKKGGSPATPPSSSWNKVSGSWTGQTLGKWDYGKPVEQLQSKLKIKADGYYGDDTVAAVKAFQKKHKLTVDGLAGKQVYTKFKELEGELTVSQYNELKKENTALKKEIAAIKELLESKLDKPSTNQTPDKDHADAFEWLAGTGITHGTNPHFPVTKEQFATMLKRFYDEFLTIYSGRMDQIVERFDGIAPYLSDPEMWKEKIQSGEIELQELTGMFIVATLAKFNQETEEVTEDE